MSRTGWLLVGALAAACAPAAAPSAPAQVVVAPAAEAEEVAPAPATAPTEYLVWLRDGGKKAKTYWVVPDPTGHRVVDSRDGTYVADGRAVWHFRRHQVQVPLYPCFGAQPPETEIGTHPVYRVTVERTPGGRTFEVVPPPSTAGTNEIEHSVALIASVGPLLFVRESVWSFSCGVHGNAEAEMFVWDLGERGPVDPLTPEERTATESHERAAALELLRKDDNAGFDQVAAKDVELTAFLPSYDESGVLSLRYLYTTGACYACSDGKWGSYTRSVEVPARAIPQSMARFAGPPPAVESFLASHPGGKLGGWSHRGPPLS